MGVIPAGLERRRGLGPDWAGWLDRLPRLVRDLLSEWELRPDGEPTHGWCSLVQPVDTGAGESAVLKISFAGDQESVHEALALQHWAGDGAVRLLRADPRRRALLLERLPGPDLASADPTEAAEVVAGLYRRLHRPAMPQLRTVGSFVTEWLAELAGVPRDWPVPHRLVEQAVATGRDLVADESAADLVVVHGDLHQRNVLAADREPWLAIDPKAMAGEPAYEPAPMLWDQLHGYDRHRLRASIRERFFTLVDVGGLDEDRARAWVVVRAVLSAHWVVGGEDGPVGSARDHITHCVAIAKAVQE